MEQPQPSPPLNRRITTKLLYTARRGKGNIHDVIVVGVPLLAIRAGVFFNNHALERLRHELKDTKDELRADIKQTKDELRAELKQTREELQGETLDVGTEFPQRI